MEMNCEFDDYCDDYGMERYAACGSPPPIQQLDYIPVVSSIAGIVRAAFGLLQIAFGIVLAPIELIVGLWSQENHQLIVIDGLANLVRGVVAFKPIIGNIALYLYDRSKLFV